MSFLLSRPIISLSLLRRSLAQGLRQPERDLRKHHHQDQSDNLQPDEGKDRHENLLQGDILGRHRLRSEEHTSELQSLMRISYAVFCLKKKKNKHPMYIIDYN